MRNLWIYGTPGSLGGAATKIRDLAILLKSTYNVGFAVANVALQKSKDVVSFCRQHGFHCILRKEVPHDPDGIALGVCELDFFLSKTAEEIKRKGMRLIWSNDMMWEFQGERDAVSRGLIDNVVFVSEIQRTAFLKIYQNVPGHIVPNYIYPDTFPYVDRTNELFTIGRLSRADPVKYPVDFPLFYEALGLGDVEFRVQAWSDELKKCYSWHTFGRQWSLYPANHIPAATFLSSLNLFVYPLGHHFVESWGRSVAEAMLTGAVPLVSVGHQFETMIEHERTGFICKSFGDYKYYAQQLTTYGQLRKEKSTAAAESARKKLFNAESHLEMWKLVLEA